MKGYKTLELTEQHLKLIKNFLVVELDDTKIGVDKIGLLGGNFAIEDTAMIFGCYDKAIQNTLEDPDGPSFPEDIREELLSIYKYVSENLYEIETLIHQFVVNGGITPGKYKCRKDDYIWSKID